VARLQVVDSGYDGPADQAPPLDRETGSAFGWYERLFLNWRDGKVFDYSDWHARDLEDALSKDSKMRQLERVLVGPLEAAKYEIEGQKGDSGEAEWLKHYLAADEFSGGMSTPLDLVTAQMTSAIAYRKAFFELVWTAGTGDFDGKIVYKKVAYRPATTCRMIRDPRTAAALGFEQEPFWVGPGQTSQIYPIQILNQPGKSPRAYMYVHGQRRDPVNGVSDLDVPMWCYKTKQKILFLWMQFAERASLPKVIVTAQDEGTAIAIAQQVARTQGSGVTPVAAPNGPQSVGINTLDISGRGGEQFRQIIDYLDQSAANSGLAGFTNLTDYSKTGGSWALSSDASDFFLQTRESVAQEMARDVRRGLIAPLIRLNFGPAAKVPGFKFGPLNAEDRSPQIGMLQALLGGRSAAEVPTGFIEEIAKQVAEGWGLDTGRVVSSFQDAAKRAQEMAAAQGMAPNAQQVAGLAGATSRAVSTVRKAQAPSAPRSA
jgi:hypothetical protein